MLSANSGKLLVSEAFRRVHENVERAVRLNCIKTGINDVGIKQVSSVLVVCNIDLRVDGLFDDFLPDGRCVNTSQSPVGKNDRSGELCIVSASGRYKRISDSLARK